MRRKADDECLPIHGRKQTFYSSTPFTVVCIGREHSRTCYTRCCTGSKQQIDSRTCSLYPVIRTDVSKGTDGFTTTVHMGPGARYNADLIAWH